jgi:hypothetical protein
MNFPLMGADPTQKDAFFEVDAQDCTDASCGGNLDLGMLGWTPNAGDVTAYTEAIVARIQADLAPVRVHLDLGRGNTNPSTWTRWGAWGGAVRSNFSPTDPQAWNLTGCEGASVGRRGYFHFGISIAPYGGHVSYSPGSCMIITNNGGNAFDAFTPGRTFAHEFGHAVGIQHGGRPGTGAVNYKQNYPSFMNYSWEWQAPGFSTGSAPTLNPTSLDETLGLGSVPSSLLTILRDQWCPGGTCVNVNTGSVDWNRDGVIQPSVSKTQGPIAHDFSEQKQTKFVNSLGDASMSWVSAGGSAGDLLFMVGRSSTGRLQVASASRATLDANCATIAPEALTEYKSPPCNAFGDVLRVIGGSGLSQGPGAAEVGPGSMIAVWQASRITLRSTLINVSGTGLVTAEPGVVMPGAVTALGDVTAVTVSSGVVKAFAMGGNPARLKQWLYTGGAWTGPVDQLWTDGTAIVPNAGIGATMGFQDSGASARLYAAIPTTSGIEFARQETSGGNAGRWTKLATWASEAQPITLGRPGLAYQHRAGKPNNHGRFYLAVNPAPSAACAQCPERR